MAVEFERDDSRKQIRITQECKCLEMIPTDVGKDDRDILFQLGSNRLRMKFNTLQ